MDEVQIDEPRVDGVMGEVSIGERNLMGRGLFAKASVQFGQYSKGFQLSFVEPYLLGYRLALGLDLFAKQQLPTAWISYQTNTIGASTRPACSRTMRSVPAAISRL